MEYIVDCDDGYPVQDVLYGYVCIPDVCIGQIEVSNSGEWYWMKDEEEDPMITDFLENMTKIQYSIFSDEITRQNQEYILNRY